jgi:hypothetical protein
MQGTDSGVDTYFGLCTYPGRELRHRIDLKVHGGFQCASSAMLLLKSRNSIFSPLIIYSNYINWSVMIFSSYCCNKQTLFCYYCWHWMVNSQAWHYTSFWVIKPTVIVYRQVYPRNRYACGLLHWTGNDVLNRRYNSKSTLFLFWRSPNENYLFRWI